MLKNIVHLILVFLLLTACKEKSPEESKISENNLPVTAHGEKVFSKIDPQKSNLVFSNTITENLETNDNLFNFDYFYNGAGVGLEDINNDGLLDVFFCSNQGDNKLFVNKGNLTFEDVSKKAGINKGKKWSNGITFVDINADGWKDIYVSQGGPNTRYNRKNLLFINNQDLTFTESAEEYGLADMGITTQSAFFDFDKDGDLDCLVMNENELYGVDPVNLYKIVKKDSETQYFNSSHLYRNDNGKFVDITIKSGIQRPIFGLGLAISDLNNDGWLDIYIASDYYIPDALFINNGNGTFTDQIKNYTNQISYYGMGIDIADINNDGKQDIFVLDMASNDHIRSKTLMASMSTSRFNYLVNKADFHYQYMYNSLQLNIGNNKYNNIAQLSGIPNTDWSWSVLMSDFDNDGHKDIYITNGYRRYALDNDLQMKVFNARTKYRNNIPLAIKKSLYEDMPSEKLPNILYQNNQNMNFKNVARKWGLGDYSFSNGAASGDLDNDGDLDLVVNNIDENAFLYQNLTTDNGLGNFLKVNTIGGNSESFAKVKISYQGKTQFIENKRVRGYMSSHDHKAHFGLGKEELIDTVTVTWLSGKVEEKYNIRANSTLEFYEDNAHKKIIERKEKTIFKSIVAKSLNLDFTHKENFYDDFDTEILLPYKQSNLGPFITKGDINGDGRKDIHIGGASGQPGQIFIQTTTGYRKVASEALENDSRHEDMEAVFFDFDGDTDLDLYVVSGGNEFEQYSSYYQDRLYINDGKGTFSTHVSPALIKYPKSGKAVTVLDFDKDGDQDILVGNRVIPKNYPKHASSVLYENDNGILKDVTSLVAKEFLDFGIVNDIIATDFDNDGWEDFIAVGEWSPIGFFKNNRGTFENITLNNTTLNERGWWFSIYETDINNDGLKDYLVGNAGLNIKFKASKKEPLKIYASDFDDNGTNDIVLSKNYKGSDVPVRGRECSSQQMPFIKEKFPTYSEFANATLVEIYGEKLDTSYENEVTEFKSILLLNKGNGKFEKSTLPIEAQVFPVMDYIATDINGDGYDDVILAGNIYETEVETPRLDAISGVVLISNKKTGYYSLPYSKSGLYLDGNVKDIEIVSLNNRTYLLVGRNNDSLLVFEME